MRAIILAAGRGSRMGEHTQEQPKCLTRLAGKSLLQWQLEALRAAGIQQTAIVRGYRGEMLAGKADTVFENPRWQETNMVSTLACAAEWLEAEPCLVSYSDIVYHPESVRALAEVEATLAITYDRLWRPLWEDRFADPLTDAEAFRLSPTGDLRAIGGNADSTEAIEGQYMGLLKFTPSGWSAVTDLRTQCTPAERDKMDMTSLLGRLLDGGVRIAAVPVAGRWCEVDNARDLHLYETRLQAAEAWAHDWREVKAA